MEGLMTYYVLPETKARIDYDKNVRGLYVSMPGRDVAETVTVNDNPVVNLDYDTDGRLLGVEILLPR